MFRGDREIGRYEWCSWGILRAFEGISTLE